MKTNSKLVQKTAMKLWKHGPTIAVIGGIIGTGFATYLTWKAARKHDAVMAEINETLDAVREDKPVEVLNEDNTVANAEEIKDYRKELAIAYAKAGLKLGKLYGPALVVDIASVSAILTGFGVLNKRNMASIAACAVAEKSLLNYRKRVVNELGEDVDREFNLGLKNTICEEPVVDEKTGEVKTDKDGNPKVKKRKIRTLEDELDCYNAHARIFGKGYSTQAELINGTDINNFDYNVNFVKQQMDFRNNTAKYRVKPVVFLNELYDACGWDICQEGQVLGYVCAPDDPEPIKYEIIPIGNKGEFIVEFYGLCNILEYI